MTTDLRLAVALDRNGWHPAQPPTGDVFTAAYWTELAREADEGGLDFVTIDDTFGGGGRPEAVLTASLLAAKTRHVGLVPVATTTHTEPFHLSTALATLDWVSNGRAGWQVRVTADPAEAQLLGRRSPLERDALFDEAADAVEVVRRLWDSWEDDAIIKDVATGRFIDRDKLHYIGFSGEFFSVKGPSIVPRSPQGQPVVAALAHAPVVYEFALRSADLVFVTPATVEEAAELVARFEGRIKVFADLTVSLDQSAASAEQRRPASEAAVFAGTPEQLADQLERWSATGLDGFRLRPADLPHDLEQITRLLVPVLEDRGIFRKHPGTLRERLGLPVAVNRYAGGRVA